VRNRCVFLDRDGVINHAIRINDLPYSPRNIAEVILFPDLMLNLARLKKAGYLLIVITNQPDVARGDMSLFNLNQINNYILTEVPLIDDIFVCIHDDSFNCNCRKPKPGLILEASIKYSLNLNKCFFIGDRWKDIHAGNIVGCRTVLINHNYAEKKPEPPYFQASNLNNAVDYILRS
jgi:D-glycero-D-manno-heptose 1,7-bisphosphate phosphatase